MTSPGPRLYTEGRGANCQDLHPGLWARLQGLSARESKAPVEILLAGSAGAGKSVLLRRYYWSLFDGQDLETPLYCAIPQALFRPGPWARRFLLETARQWVAFERRDPALVLAGLPPPPVLLDQCYDARLRPVGEAIEAFARLEAQAADGAFLIEWVFDAVAAAADRLGRRVCLLVDGPENAAWTDRGESEFLVRAVRPLEPGGPLRRIWTLRQTPGAAAPLSDPLPPAREQWEVPPLSTAAAEEFFACLAREACIDYDRPVFRDYLPLWGNLPRWLAHFARQAATSPRSLTAPDHFLHLYVADLLEGPTARSLHDALQMALPGAPYDPAQLARTAHERLAWEDVDRPPAAPHAPGTDKDLRRLARAGLADYRQGRWEAPAVPLLADFLSLFIARHHRGENLVRREVALKRKRLVETPRRVRGQEQDRRLQHLQLLLHTFREQTIPAALFQAHGTGDPAEPAAGQAATLAQAARNRTIRMPHCIGAFPLENPAPRNDEGDPLPAVLGWCFEGPECYRSGESLWIAYLCDAPVITSEEINRIERRQRRLAREYEVGRVAGWLVTNGRFSPESLQRIDEVSLLVSRWEDCEALGDLLLARSGGRAEPHRPTAAPPPEPPKIVEILLPPRADMELLAAGTLEQLAHSLGYDKTTVGQMKMALLEACLNAIERSGNPEKMVRLRFEATNARFVAIVENEGDTFDPQAVEKPVLEAKMGQSYKRGWGLQLIRKFMDRVVFEPFERGTRLRMEKANPAAAAPADAREAWKA